MDLSKDIILDSETEESAFMNTLSRFRDYRGSVFKAFDIYKTNIEYGINIETEDEHNDIITWYNTMLNFPNTITIDNYKTIEYPSLPEILSHYL